MASITGLQKRKLGEVYGPAPLGRLMSMWLEHDPTATKKVAYKRRYWEEFRGTWPTWPAPEGTGSFTLAPTTPSVISEGDVVRVLSELHGERHQGPAYLLFNDVKIGELVESPIRVWHAHCKGLPEEGTAGELSAVWYTSGGTISAKPVSATII